MSIAAALILVVEAATSCAPAGPARLGGGAIVMRAVGSFEEIPFVALGPTTSIVAAPGIEQTGSSTAEREPRSGQPVDRCAAAPFPVA